MAERRKNEPQLDQTQDHLVRKLFSRFRKAGPADRVSTGSSLQTESSGKDVEKGVSERSDSENDASHAENKVLKVFPATKVATEKEQAPAPVAVRPKGKWGALMGGGPAAASPATTAPSTPTVTTTGPADSSGAAAGTASAEDNKNMLSVEPSRSGMNKLKALTGASGQSGNKVFPKAPKAMVTTAGRQETIEELTETASGGSPSKSPPIPLDSQNFKESIAPASGPFQLPAPSTMSAEYQQIMAHIMDFKVDVKLEIQRLNQKMSKMEDMLSEIVSKLNQTLNGPSTPGPLSTSQFAHRLLSPTTPSPHHSDTGHDRDTSPASGDENPPRSPHDKEKHEKKHRSGHHHHHHHHKHRDRDRDRDKDRHREKTPDTLSPNSSRVSSSDVATAVRSKKSKSRQTKTSSSATTTGRTSTAESGTTQGPEDETEEASSSKHSSAGSKEALLPIKPVIIPTGQRSREFL